jgi:hypothetical protein
MKKILLLMTIIFTKIFTVNVDVELGTLGNTYDGKNYLIVPEFEGDDKKYVRLPIEINQSSNSEITKSNHDLLIPTSKLTQNSEKDYLLLSMELANQIKSKLAKLAKEFYLVLEFLKSAQDTVERWKPHNVHTDINKLNFHPKLYLSDLLEHRPWRKVAQIFAEQFHFDENKLIQAYIINQSSFSPKGFLELLEKEYNKNYPQTRLDQLTPHNKQFPEFIKALIKGLKSKYPN